MFSPKFVLFSIFCGIVASSCFQGTSAVAAPSTLTMTVLYDNYPYRQGLVTGNGFSCLIRGTEKTILFDTSPDGNALLHNMNMMNVDPKEIDSIVISHPHGDHTGGLISFLGANRAVSLFVPPGLSADLVQQIAHFGINMTTVSRPVPICKGIYSIVGSGAGLTEQFLVINSRHGLILITGCAHPEITKIIGTATNMFRKPVLFVYGGFHLQSASDDRIREIIKLLMAFGVKKVGGSHCTGLRAMQLFKEAYGANYIQMGGGITLALQ